MYRPYTKRAKSNNTVKYIEDSHCKALIEWISKIGKYEYPELALLYKIKNENPLGVIVGARMKAVGIRAGMPDYHLPVARDIYHSLYIEMKGPDGVLSESQKIMIPLLCHQGNKVVACYSVDEAQQELIKYIESPYVYTDGRQD